MHEFILHEQAQCLHTRRHTQFHACKKKEEERKAIFKSSHGLVDVVGPFQLIKAFMCSSCALRVSGDVYLLSWVKLKSTTIPLMPWSTSLWSVCPVISGSISFLTLIYFYKNLMSSNWIFTASLSSNMLSKTEKKVEGFALHTNKQQTQCSTLQPSFLHVLGPRSQNFWLF